MRNRITVAILALVSLALSPAILAQERSFERPTTETQPDKELTPGPGWKTCPRCTNPKQLAAAYKTYKVDGHPFDPHDLSGIWGNNGLELEVKNVPPFTPLGQQMFEATRSEIPTTNSKDGMLICDPLGFPRLFAYNYGFQFVMLPDRVLQFYEWGHTWRDIWTDGRKLPADPPQPRWLGYAVGRWEGDTLVVEGSGYDDRSWISEDRRWNAGFGFRWSGWFFAFRSLSSHNCLSRLHRPSRPSRKWIRIALRQRMANCCRVKTRLRKPAG